MKDYCIENSSREHLKANCEKCIGFCCVALYFSASEGFPVNKAAGVPCPNLAEDFRCKVHSELKKLGYKGCMSFDCFGAGHKVAQTTYVGKNWREGNFAKQMFEVFLIMRQINEMLWYLKEAYMKNLDPDIRNEVLELINITQCMTEKNPETLLKLDLMKHRQQVSSILIKASEPIRTKYDCGIKSNRKLGPGTSLIGADLRKAVLKGANLRGAYLIAANLKNVDFSGTILLGADFRDADLSGANLTESIYLTQAQLNSAKGDMQTKIPSELVRPIQWAN